MKTLLDVYKEIGCPFYAEVETFDIWTGDISDSEAILCLFYEASNGGFPFYSQSFKKTFEYDYWRYDLNVIYYEPLNEKYLHSEEFKNKFEKEIK